MTRNIQAVGLTRQIARFARMDIEGVKVSVKPLSKVHLFSTPEQLGEELGAEYTNQILLQIFKIIAGQIVSKVARKTTKARARTRPTRFFDSTGMLFVGSPSQLF